MDEYTSLELNTFMKRYLRSEMEVAWVQKGGEILAQFFPAEGHLFLPFTLKLDDENEDEIKAILAGNSRSST